MIVCTPETKNQEGAVKFLKDCIAKAKAKGLIVPDVLYVDFNITSATYAGTAGQMGVHKGCNRGLEVDYHAKALEHYGLERFQKTLAHEFCHILQFVNRPGDKAHGIYFYRCMSILGFTNLKNSYHDFDLRAVTGKPRRKQRRWEYKCDCQTHKIATVTHNRVQRGQQSRICKSCRATIHWTGKECK